jgi:hypothetical protein
MADYAGAVAAMKARFAAAWTETPITYANQDPPQQPWPPATPWVYVEFIQSNSSLRALGSPTNRSWLTLGHIFIHVFVPINYGIEEPQRLAVAAGEIFRAQTFYNDGLGAKVVCYAPATQGGASDADNGDWFRLTASIPFEFYFNA